MQRRQPIVPSYTSSLDYSTILSIVSTLGIDDKGVLLGYLALYPDAKTEENKDMISLLCDRAMDYYRDVVLPAKKYRDPSEDERLLLTRLAVRTENAADGSGEKELQSIPFDLCRDEDLNPRDLFKMFYECILGQSQGPRYGTLASIIGKERMAHLIRSRL